MYVLFEEGLFICSELGKGATNEAGKYIFRANNAWRRCAYRPLLNIVFLALGVEVCCMFV